MREPYIIIKFKEKWKKIKYVPYAVSNFGNVKRLTGGKGTRPGRLLKNDRLDKDGYASVILYGKDDKRFNLRIARLVAEAFIGPCPKGKQVNHVDGVKLNNHVWNLEYVTPRENQIHALENGLRKRKLKKSGVIEMRKMYKTNKYTQIELAEIFNVSDTWVNHIVNYKAADYI